LLASRILKQTMTDTIRIGSRGSQLALWQANHIAAALRDAGHAVEIEIIRTTGDRMQQPDASAPETDGLPALAPLADGKGIFIKEIEEALAEGRIDLAVHSLKDLPTELDARFMLAAIPPRVDPRDAWVCEQYWALHTLPMGGRVGTTSPRRRAQLLASAGLDRLGRAESVHQRFAVEELCPAPGQGALALETRAASYAVFAEPEHDDYVRGAVAALDHCETRFSIEVERTVLDGLGGGCQIPIGVNCAPLHDGSKLIGWRIHAQVLAPDGEQMIAHTSEASAGANAKDLGRQVAEDLKARGALELLSADLPA
jgi:hydroxymethylbilane synthase